MAKRERREEGLISTHRKIKNLKLDLLRPKTAHESNVPLEAVSPRRLRRPTVPLRVGVLVPILRDGERTLGGVRNRDDVLEGRVARVRGGEGAEGCDDGSAGEDELGFVRETVGGYEGDSTEVELGVRKEVVRKKKTD